MKRLPTIKQSSGTVIILVSLILSNAASAASPDNTHGDYFGRSTAPPPTNRAPATRVPVSPPHRTPAQPQWIGPRAKVSDTSSTVEWFEAVDTYVGYFRPSNEDRVILSKPFSGPDEVERVEHFCRTLNKMARNYRLLAKRLCSLPIPMNLPEAQRYRDLHANWYNDQALLYEDMIRPRPPARTKEELAALMKDLNDRSESLAEQFTTLQVMDLDLRKKYGVHAARYDDALYEYTRRDLPEHAKQQLDKH